MSKSTVAPEDNQSNTATPKTRPSTVRDLLQRPADKPPRVEPQSNIIAVPSGVRSTSVNELYPSRATTAFVGQTTPVLPYAAMQTSPPSTATAPGDTPGSKGGGGVSNMQMMMDDDKVDQYQKSSGEEVAVSSPPNWSAGYLQAAISEENSGFSLNSSSITDHMQQYSSK